MQKWFGSWLVEEYQPKKMVDPKKWSWKPANISGIRNPDQFCLKKNFFQYSFGAKSKTVFFCGDVRGPHVGYLIKECLRQKVSVIALHWEEMLAKCTVSTSTNNLNSSYIQRGGSKIILKNVDAVYFTEPAMWAAYRENQEQFTSAEKIYFQRWHQFLLQLKSIVPEKKWWPTAVDNFEPAQKKWDELLLAKKYGFVIPDTIVTNNTHEAKAFYRKHKDEVVIREIGLRYVVENHKLQIFKIEPRRIAMQEWKHFRKSPVFLQQYLTDKKSDVRIVVVGEKALAFEILSQQTDYNKYDWRAKSDQEMPVREIRLPKKIHVAATRMAKEIGLHIACLDLVVDSKNQFWFLEINRPGAWLFLELRAGTSVGKTIVENLKK